MEIFIFQKFSILSRNYSKFFFDIPTKMEWKKYFYNITSGKKFKYFFHDISPPNIYTCIYETYRISHVMLKTEATVKNSEYSTN